MIKGLILTVLLVSFSASGRAKDYAYQGKVEGMVCAFCAYDKASCPIITNLNDNQKLKSAD